MKNRFPKRSEGAIFDVLDGKTVILSPADYKVYLLNRTAACAWQLLDGKRDENYIASKIKNKFSARSNGKVRRDLKTLIKDLKAKGLLGAG